MTPSTSRASAVTFITPAVVDDERFVSHLNGSTPTTSHSRKMRLRSGPFRGVRCREIYRDVQTGECVVRCTLYDHDDGRPRDRCGRVRQQLPAHGVASRSDRTVRAVLTRRYPDPSALARGTIALVVAFGRSDWERTARRIGCSHGE
jgi:hypothetical protein